MFRTAALTTMTTLKRNYVPRQSFLRWRKATFVSSSSLLQKQPQQHTDLIINAVGQDRLGIVSDITGMVIDVGGNVGDSQATKLGPYFALMMMVSVPKEQFGSLQSMLQTMPQMNATLFEPTPMEHTTIPPTPQIAYSASFTVKGADHPGIVYKITSAFRKWGLSIDQMETDQEIAPLGGSILFHMKGIVTATAPLAQEFNPIHIQQYMEELGDTLNCEVIMKDKTVDGRYEGSFYAG